MNTRVRIRTIRLIEKIEKKQGFAEKIGIVVLSEGRNDNEQNDEDFDGTINNRICCSSGSNTGSNR